MRKQYDTHIPSSAINDFSDPAAQAENLYPDYVRYEAKKASLRSEYPNAMPSEYEQAIAAIARACGV